MRSPEVPAQVRQRLVALLAEDRPDGGRLLGRLRELRLLEGVHACSAVVHLLAHLNLKEDDAEELLVDLLAHREHVTNALGRDPGLRVAAIDYLSNIRPLLSNPTIVEQSQFDKTERSAITDDLTSLYNRRHFQSALDIELRRSRRYASVMSVLMLDLDSFKSVNDLHGHPFGDLVLERTGRILHLAVRESDVACRIGGEEFAVLLPETDRLGAHAVAERIRHRVEREFAASRLGGRLVAMTISGGIASHPEDGVDAATLVSHADQALYRSKTGGRNRIVVYHAERRKSVRYPVSPRATATLTRPELAPVGDVQAVDLSLDGALLETAESFAPADAVELTLDVGAGVAGEGIGPLTVEGTVVRVEAAERPDRSRVAVAFDRRLSEARMLPHVLTSRPFSVSGQGRGGGG